VLRDQLARQVVVVLVEFGHAERLEVRG
jgi:hypothetical protein